MLRLADFEIIDATTSKFILLAERFGAKKSGPPTPLRRVLSLMRTEDFKCQTIVYKYTFWTPSNRCSGQECGKRIESCQDYIDNLPSYGYEFKRKHCHKLCFFRSPFGKKIDLSSQRNEDLIGFCIVHADEWTRNGKIDDCSYITEAILPSPFGKRGYMFCPQKVEIEIGGTPFEIEGHYFAQQNSITNCCSHAAIKTATRKCYSLDSEITCKKINEVIEVDHENKKANELGLDDICIAIERLTNQKAFVLDPSRLFSLDHFLTMIYQALESRLPVILLFCMPERNTKEELESEQQKLLKGRKFEELGTKEREYVENIMHRLRSPGHAVAVTGHTFNEHNWFGYALKEYFFANDYRLRFRYLPNHVWCDHFIVQDDVVGPNHLMPTRFLRDFIVSKGLLSTVQTFLKSVPFPVSQDYPWLASSDSILAIIVHSEELAFFPCTSEAEVYAFERLRTHIQNDQQKLKEEQKLPKTTFFQKYFYRYYKGNGLILRTFIISKEEYLHSLEENKSVPAVVLESIDLVLPHVFWITEISIPELFWVNKSKIGELITDPYVFSHASENAVTLMRLPNYICLIPDGLENNLAAAQFEQDESHQPLISLKKPPLF